VGRKEIASSLILVLAGVGYLIHSTRYPLDTSANPGPGLFPLIVGGVFVILAACQLARSFLKRKPSGDVEPPTLETRPVCRFIQWDRGETKPLFMIVVFIIYLVMVRWAGFFSSNFLFVIAASRLMGARDWGRPIALSAGVSVFCYFLFEVWLKLSFPRGILF
jgi:hypothetical protein